MRRRHCHSNGVCIPAAMSALPILRNDSEAITRRTVSEDREPEWLATIIAALVAFAVIVWACITARDNE